MMDHSQQALFWNSSFVASVLVDIDRLLNLVIILILHVSWAKTKVQNLGCADVAHLPGDPNALPQADHLHTVAEFKTII